MTPERTNAGPGATPLLEMRGITKRYPGVVANDGISLDVRAGEIHALLGENGAGKSTLMNILYGLAVPDEGEILLDGKPVEIDGPNDAIRRGISMVHQHFMLVPVLTVAENILLGAFGDGYLWISSGDRQKFDPAQDMNANLGKVLRLNEDGSVPRDNPFADRGGVTAQIWSLGHRNPLGLAFDAQGRLWDVEMGPQGGDELNLVRRGANYGYPIVSNGDHYDGKVIPDHDTRPEFAAPAVWWNPVISPSSLLFYDGSEFPQWRGDAFIGGLSSQAIIRIEFDGDNAREAERYNLGMRIRAIEQGPDGALWILEDEREGRGGQGRMFKLTARAASGQ